MFQNSSKLSVCIPVYNCEEFLGQALDSILPQTDGSIEVIVYDGGSTDETPALMNNYLSVWPNLKYYRGSQRGGIDADMATCVGFAHGDYCWLFSGDDVMRPGAIVKALTRIELNEYDVFICKHTICNKHMIVSHEHPVLEPDQEFSVNLSNANERLEWFKRAVTTEAFFSFISGLIVKREKWLKGELPQAFNGSCWGHVARFFGLIPSGLSVCYIGEVWLDQRGENDSFVDRGIVNRFRIGIEGYHQLADVFFGHNSYEAFCIRKAVKNEFALKSFLLLKIHCMLCPERESKQMLDSLVQMVYCDKSVSSNIKYFIYFYCTPDWLIAFTRFLYQPIKHIRKILKNA